MTDTLGETVSCFSQPTSLRSHVGEDKNQMQYTLAGVHPVPDAMVKFASGQTPATMCAANPQRML